MAHIVGRRCVRFLELNKLINSSVLYPSSVLTVHLQHRKAFTFQRSVRILPIHPSNVSVKYFSKKIYDKDEDEKKLTSEVDGKGKDQKKLSLFQRFKQMYRDYWYVLVPVHVVTSVAWFGGFYYMAKSGVDIVAILESMHISEKITHPLKDSSMGYLAVAYALYKIATPARYTVTLGGTTISINYLKKWGYIKPVPSAGELKELYIEKKANLIETMRETKEELMNKADKIKDQKDNIMDDFGKSIQKIKDSSESIKNKKKDIVENINKTLEKSPTK